MERWQNKVAAVTGTGSGIGAAIVNDLLQGGLKVVGLARFVDRLKALKGKLPINLQAKFIALECDVSKVESIKQELCTAEPEEIQRILQNNVMGVVFCTQGSFQSIKKRKFDGHVVLVNSISGHRMRYLPNYTPDNNIYGPSKFAITALTEIYRQEFKGLGTKVKVISISSGATETEIIPKSMKHTIAVVLKPEDISQGIIFALSTPPHVQIHEMTIKPVDEMF